jgi:serine protease
VHNTQHRGLSGIIASVAIFATGSIASPGQVDPDVETVLTDTSPPAIESVHQHFLLKLVDATGGISALQALATHTGVVFEAAREISPGLYMLQVHPVSGESMAQTLVRLRADANVEFADPDQWRFPSSVPNDSLYSQQWYLQSTEASATNVTAAWDTTTGRRDIVIADLDTGVRFDHPDLLAASANGRLLSGYDFVSDAAIANDGDGRDSDPSDPGDWVSSADTQIAQFSGCTVMDSTWHGTRVVGILGALSNNGIGIAGMTWGPRLLPVRVLGKCGGLDSDILDALRWAAGLHVTGVPDNTHPAQIINLSLGGEGSCSHAQQVVISEVLATGAIVVAAAGNDGTSVDSPADCNGVLGVGAVRNSGTKDYFSNLGPTVDISAPGGNCVSSTGPCTYTLDTTTNSGTTTPALNGYTNPYYPNLGTSFSTPIVAGIAALMLSVNSNLSSDQLTARLKEGAKPFPTAPAGAALPVCQIPSSATGVQNFECVCTTQTCGAGMVNAPGALTAALRPIAAIALPSAVIAGRNLSLSGASSGTACNRTIATYVWSDVTNPTAAIKIADTATASITAPASGSITLRLTVTDDAGRTDSADVIVGSNTATTNAPAVANTRTCAVDGLSVSPITTSVQASGATQTFTAAIIDDTDTAVTWYVNKVLGGDTRNGTITSAGIYTPPAVAPYPNVVTVTAVWNSDSTKYADAQVTINLPLTISVIPVVANVVANGTTTFTANVVNAVNTDVTWSVNGIAGGSPTIGTMSSSGVYTAPTTVPSPLTVTITAISIVDDSKSASATMTVTASSTSAGGSSTGGSSTSSGNGGGGPIDPLTLAGYGGIVAWVAYRRRSGRRRSVHDVDCNSTCRLVA